MDLAVRRAMFYFLAAGWVFRALDQFRNDAEPAAWWGRSDWRSLIGIGQSRLAIVFQERFQSELGYRFVNSYPIFSREKGKGRIMFYMIHASDHPEAPVLMRRAYNNIVQPLESHEQLQMELGVG